METSVMPSRAERRQFMAGSEESPVSMARTYGVSSSKHSERDSKPEAAPKMEKCGVQACAGISIASAEASSSSASSSFASSFRIGLPSEARFPMRERERFNLLAAAMSGSRTRQCTFLVRPFFR